MIAVTNLVVSCAKRKTREPRASLLLRAVRPGKTVGWRAAAWATRLRAQSVTVPAGDLYAGEHWQIVRSIAERSALSVRVWVVSAGYGLVRLDTPLAPYSATFTPGQADSVCAAGGKVARVMLPEWWHTIANHLVPHAGPRTIAAVAAAYPADFLLVALSGTYLSAVALDLAAAAALRGPEQIAVVSAGGGTFEPPVPSMLPATGRLSGFAGGTMSALNVRLARRLLEELGPEPLTYTRCQATVESWCRQAPQRTMPARGRATDREVAEFIRRQLAATGPTSPTALLRRLRDTGRACGQARFADLYRRTGGGCRADG